MGSKELRKRNRDKIENKDEGQNVKHKNKVENTEEEKSIKHKDKVHKEGEQSVKHKKSKEHDCSQRRKTCREDYHRWGHHEHVGQMSHDTSHTKTVEHDQHMLIENSESKDRSHSSHNRCKKKTFREDYNSWGHHEQIGQMSHDTSHTNTTEEDQHTLTDNLDNKDKSHWSHNTGKSHEHYRGNKRKHNTCWSQDEEFRCSTRKGYIHTDRSTDWWNDRWCPEKLTPERGDTMGMGLNMMSGGNTVDHITTDRWYPERYDKEDQWPSYNKEVEKMQKQSVDVHRHKGAAAMRLAKKRLTLSELEYSTEYDSRVHGWIKVDPDYASGQSLHGKNTLIRSWNRSNC